MKYGGIRMVIKRAAKKAGIKKRFYNHLFRHSRITEYATFMTQAQLEKNMGWVHGTQQSDTHIHLAGAQVDNTILEHYGIKDKQELPSKMTPIKCSCCNTTKGPTAKFCSSCRMTLTTEAAYEVENDEQRILGLFKDYVKNNPEKFGDLL